MPIRKEDPTDRVILRLKSEGLSFTEISSRLCLPRIRPVKAALPNEACC